MPKEERALFYQPKKKHYGLFLFYIVVIAALTGTLVVILPPWLKQIHQYANAAKEAPKLPTPADLPLAKMAPGILSDEQTEVKSITQVPKQGGWINSEPLNIPGLAARGYFVLIYFWSAEVPASNRANKQVEAWWKAYKDHGLIVVGVHTPKYGVDTSPQVVLDAVQKQGLTFPVLLDGKGFIAKSFNNYSWPGWQVMDPQGNIFLSAKGEGRYAQAEEQVRKALKTKGWQLPNQLAANMSLIPSRDVTTPDLYLGGGFVRRQLGNGMLPLPGKSASFVLPNMQDADSVYLDGTWKGNNDFLESQSHAVISIDYFASTVYATLASASGKAIQVLVLLDGQPVPSALAGPDLIYQHGQSYMIVDVARVYQPLLERAPAARHEIMLKTGPGLRAYEFSFARF